MEFNNFHQARKWFLKYKPLDRSVEIFWTEYDSSNWKFGDYILIQHVRNGKEISRPTLAVFTGFNVWDQALVVEFVQSRRAWMYSNHINIAANITGKQLIAMLDIEAEQIQLWTDNIKVLGHWKQRPTIKQLKQALKGQI